MKDKEIINFLNYFFDMVKSEQIKYRFAGDFALFIQGMEIIPNKLQIICDNFSFVDLKYLLEKYLIKSGRNEEVGADYFRIFLFEISIDFMSFDNKKIEMLDKIYFVSWNNLEIPVISLLETKKYYDLIGKNDRIQQIQNFLNQRKNRI